jgi:VanZ family protein
LAASYAILKPNPLATDLPLMPSAWAEWLDYAADFRTFVLTVLVGLAAAVLLAGVQHNLVRRRLIVAITLLLVLLETLQAFIPHRSPSLADIAYTIAGGCTLEAIAWGVDRLSRKKPTLGNRDVCLSSQRRANATAKDR